MTETEADVTTASDPAPPLKPWLQTPAGKVGMILVLIVLMQIPYYMVSGLIHEREQRQTDVLADFRRGWGPEQTLIGPTLFVPWHRPGSSEPVSGWARVSASKLDTAVRLTPEERRRGLFHAMIYQAAVEMKGTITVPEQPIKYQPDALLDWSAARILIGATDLRGTGADPVITLNGNPVSMRATETCQDPKVAAPVRLLEAPVRLDSPPAPGSVMPFSTSLTMRGTQAFNIVPSAQELTMTMSSPWRYPSFTGATLPLDDQITQSGFTASWQATGSPADFGWRPGTACLAEFELVLSDAPIGVTLQEAVPTYAMVDRTAKYSILFLTLTYLTLFLFETLSRVRIHLVQYGMVGLSLSLFALLLISIAEPLGFTVSYAISAFAIVAQASLYTLSVVGQRRLALVFASMLTGLFGFLYVVLSLDAYALLAGTVALFAILSVVMRVTRRVDWSASAGAS